MFQCCALIIPKNFLIAKKLVIPPYNSTLGKIPTETTWHNPLRRQTRVSKSSTVSTQKTSTDAPDASSQVSLRMNSRLAWHYSLKKKKKKKKEKKRKKKEKKGKKKIMTRVK